jgi:hypothetical protein
MPAMGQFTLRYFGVARTNHFRVAKNVDFEMAAIPFLNAFEKGTKSVLIWPAR